MFLRPNVHSGARTTLTARVPRILKQRLEARASQSNRTLSALVAELLEVALDLEGKLRPFQPAIERLIREDGLTVPDATVALIWMGVELDPDEVAPPRLQ